jgi:hypothetical protein
VDYGFIFRLWLNLRLAVQLGESGEYRMGRVRVVYFHVWSSEDGSHHLCLIKDRVGWA